MTKILLVEDDKSLREIYGVRLLAEGYDIVSADNGEEALAVAIKERPQLIITDVMMPKISGFDMLDILRSTTETREIKVIVMTALGSEENRERSERLGADRYLVKSQVGIEDVVRAVHDLLGDQPAVAAPAAPAPLPTQPPAGRTLVSAPPVAFPGAPANQASPMPSQTQPLEPQIPTNAATANDDIPTRRARIIQPINDPNKTVDLQALVDKELAKEGGLPPVSEAQQRAVVEDQLDTILKNDTPASPAPAPAPSVAPESLQPRSAVPAPAPTQLPTVSPPASAATAPSSSPTPAPMPARAPSMPAVPPRQPAPTAPTPTPAVTPAPIPPAAPAPQMTTPQPTAPPVPASPAPPATPPSGPSPSPIPPSTPPPAAPSV